MVTREERAELLAQAAAIMLRVPRLTRPVRPEQATLAQYDAFEEAMQRYNENIERYRPLWEEAQDCVIRADLPKGIWLQTEVNGRQYGLRVSQRSKRDSNQALRLEVREWADQPLSDGGAAQR